MRLCAIIAEYNPFHNGHLHQLKSAREACSADYIIVIMSGMFTQRGEPAIVDKFARARMVLESGADLVIELPAGYVLQSAEYFAMGAVSILDSLNTVNFISYGTEAADPLAHELVLKYVDTIWDKENNALESCIRSNIKQGMPYPEACILAFEDEIKTSAPHLLPYIPVLRKPNAILEVSYLSAIKRLNAKIKPLPIERIKADYHDREITSSIASATAIRESILNQKPWQQAVPSAALQTICDRFTHCEGPICREDLYPALMHVLASTPDDIKSLPDMSEELTNCILKSIPSAQGFSSLVSAAQTRRFTGARISRSLMSLILGMTHRDITAFRQHLPRYARVLGFKKEAERLLSTIIKKASIPIITQLPQFRAASQATQRLFELDLIASNVYYLCAMGRADLYNWEYRQRLITV